MNGMLRHKIALQRFWSQFSGKKTDGRAFTTTQKIDALKRMANVVIRYSHQRSLSEKREEYERLKPTLHKIRTKRNSICFCCGEPIQARHHIIQLQNGGLNTKKNMISICNSCHAEIHPWLNLQPFHSATLHVAKSATLHNITP